VVVRNSRARIIVPAKKKRELVMSVAVAETLTINDVLSDAIVELKDADLLAVYGGSMGGVYGFATTVATFTTAGAGIGGLAGLGGGAAGAAAGAAIGGALGAAFGIGYAIGSAFY
jgi:hypothetical protein